MVPTGKASGAFRLGLAEVLALVATTAIGLALDRAYAPSLFTRSTPDFGDRLAVLAIILTPCVILGLMTLILMRVLRPRIGWRPPTRLVTSLLAVGFAVGVVAGLMSLVMRVVVGLAE